MYMYIHPGVVAEEEAPDRRCHGQQDHEASDALPRDHTYIYIYIHMYIQYTYIIHLYLSLSLSMCVYIYIYIHIVFFVFKLFEVLYVSQHGCPAEGSLTPAYVAAA